MSTLSNSPLYFSRLMLNPRSRQVMSEIAHPYEMHRTVMRAFPKATDEERRKARDEFAVLFRTEVGHSRAVKVYVQSRVEPNWSFLDGLIDYLSADTEMPGCECKDIMPAFQRIKNGQVLSFRLLANPTKRIGKVVKGAPDLKGKRVGLLGEEKQIEWLVRKGKERERDLAGGFEILMGEIEKPNGEIDLVPRVAVRMEERLRCRKQKDGLPHSTTHLAVRFEGLLRVTEADSFRETLILGIGPAKAFGFGLLSVAPVHS